MLCWRLEGRAMYTWFNAASTVCDAVLVTDRWKSWMSFSRLPRKDRGFLDGWCGVMYMAFFTQIPCPRLSDAYPYPEHGL